MPHAAARPEAAPFQDLGAFRHVAVALPRLDALCAERLRDRAGLALGARIDVGQDPDAEGWELDVALTGPDGALVEPVDRDPAWRRVRRAFGLPPGSDTRDLARALLADLLGADGVEVFDLYTERWPVLVLLVPLD